MPQVYVYTHFPWATIPARCPQVQYVAGRWGDQEVGDGPQDTQMKAAWGAQLINYELASTILNGIDFVLMTIREHILYTSRIGHFYVLK